VRDDILGRPPGPPKGTGRIYLHPVAVELVRVFRKHRLDLEQIVQALTLETTLEAEERAGASVWVVRRFLEDTGLNRLPPLQNGEETAPVRGQGVFEETEPGFVQIDTIFCPRTSGRARRYIYVAIERTTRWLFMEAREDRSAADGSAFLASVLAACPLKIHTVLSDNGSEWKAGFVDLATVEELDHRHTKPRAPETNGMVERMNGTIKRHTPFKTKDFWLERPGEEMTPGRVLQGFYKEDTRFVRINRELKQWSFFWNAVRPHKVLNWQTPLEQLQALYVTRPELFRFDPSRDLPPDLEDWKDRIGGHRFIYPPPGIGNRSLS
jgi:transposase-like protein